MSIGHAIGDAFAKLSTVLCGVKDDDDDKAPPAPVASAVSSSINDVAVARAKIHAQADCGECGNCLDKPEYGGPNKRRAACVKKIVQLKQLTPNAFTTFKPPPLPSKGGSKPQKARDKVAASDEAKKAPHSLAPGAQAGSKELGPPVAHLIEAEPLMGQDKWLGGVLGSDGCVYGVPGHSTTVLRIDPTDDAVSVLPRGDGQPLLGKYKWLRGNLHQDGSIYCIPCHASTVLKIDCTTNPPVISEMGGPHPGDWKWHGAVLSPYDQCIYGIPQFAETVLKIDPHNQTTSEIGGPFPGASPTGKHKWYGGLLGGDGCIYRCVLNASNAHTRCKTSPFTTERLRPKQPAEAFARLRLSSVSASRSAPPPCSRLIRSTRPRP